MKKMRMIFMLAGILGLSSVVFPEPTAEQRNQGQVVVTVLPKKGIESPESILNQNLQLKINGKAADITGWLPLREQNSGLEMVILIDSSAQANLGLQFDEIAAFIRSMSSDAKLAIGYMLNGQAVLAGPLSTDHDKVVNDLRILGSPAGSNASPYFCLSDLAKHWPSSDPAVRRQVVMISDGVDGYGEPLDLNDQYVKAAIEDSARAGLVVYAIFWPNQGSRDRSGINHFDGQNLLSQVTQATGGQGYWTGKGQPVSLSPYFNDITLRLKNQYRLSFSSPIKGKPKVQSLSLKASHNEAEFCAPQRVLIGNLAGE
jgi:hypothetical protein